MTQRTATARVLFKAETGEVCTEEDCCVWCVGGIQNLPQFKVSLQDLGVEFPQNESYRG